MGKGEALNAAALTELSTIASPLDFTTLTFVISPEALMNTRKTHTAPLDVFGGGFHRRFTYG